MFLNVKLLLLAASIVLLHKGLHHVPDRVRVKIQPYGVVGRAVPFSRQLIGQVGLDLLVQVFAKGTGSQTRKDLVSTCQVRDPWGTRNSVMVDKL